MWIVLVLVVLVLVLVLVLGENKVNSYSDQLKLVQVCMFGVQFEYNTYYILLD